MTKKPKTKKAAKAPGAPETTAPAAPETKAPPRRRPSRTETRLKSCMLHLADLVQAQTGTMPSEQRCRAEPFLAEAAKLRKER